MYPVFYPPAGTVLYIPFATYAGATGASVTLTGLAITDIEIYKNGSVTQRASDAGYVLLDTDGIDVDGITGIHGFSMDLADNTDAGFYAVGSWYTVVVSAVTVDSQTVNFIAGVFRIAPAETVAGYPKVDTSHFGGTAGTFSSGLPTALLSSGTGAGQLSITSGVVSANLAQILGTALTETAGLLAAGFKKWFNVAAPTGTVNSIPDAVPGAANALLRAGTNTPVTITGSGNALTLTSTAAGGHALALTGEGAGYGAYIQGGASGGHGVRVQGKTTGIGLLLESVDSVGLGVVGGSGGSGNGMSVTGAGHGIAVTGGTGAAIVAQAGTLGVSLLLTGKQIGSTGNSTTAIHLPDLDYDATELPNYLLMLSDNSGSDRVYLRWIDAWNNTSKIATVALLPITPANASDRYSLIPFARRDVSVSAAGVDAVWDDTVGDGTITARQALRILIAGMAGKLSGAATTTATIRNLADSANVIVATVDVDGNRTAVTVTP